MGSLGPEVPIPNHFKQVLTSRTDNSTYKWFNKWRRRRKGELAS